MEPSLDRKYYKLFVKPKYITKTKKFENSRLIDILKPKLKVPVARWFKNDANSREIRNEFITFMAKLSDYVLDNESKKVINDCYYQVALWGRQIFKPGFISRIGNYFRNISETGEREKEIVLYKRICSSLVSFTMRSSYESSFPINHVKRVKNGSSAVVKIKKEHWKKYSRPKKRKKKTVFINKSRGTYTGFSTLGSQSISDYQNRNDMLMRMNLGESSSGKGQSNHESGNIFPSGGKFSASSTQKDTFQYHEGRNVRVIGKNSSTINRRKRKVKSEIKKRPSFGISLTGQSTYRSSYNSKVTKRVSQFRSKTKDFRSKCPFGVLVGSKFQGSNYMTPTSKDYSATISMRPTTAFGSLENLSHGTEKKEYHSNRNILNGPTNL